MKNIANAIFSILQKVGKSLMVPVSVLPAAGLLVALGRVLQDYGADYFYMVALGKIFFSGGLAIFENLSVVFAIGVAIGFTGGAGVAGLAALVGYYTLTNILKVVTELRELSLAINTGVFGGIIIGLVTAYVYKRFHQTKLPRILGFFEGKRLVPIMTAISAVFVGLLLGMIWPPIQNQINEFGMSIMNSNFGPAFFAAGKRALIPVGLHHVYYPPFLFEFGEYIDAAGKVFTGDSGRYFAGDPNAGKIMASEFPILLFGLPAACLAMYLRAPKNKRAAVGGVMLSAALTSIITGITEPIEFSFIFVAPALYIFHVVASFASGMMTHYFDIHLGATFSPSMIDFALGYFNQKNSQYLWLVVGPIMALCYFGAFYTLIPIFNYKTPGRDESTEDDQLSQTAIAPTDLAKEVYYAIGQAKNIKELDACITRLRLIVNDPSLVDIKRLKAIGSSGVMNTGSNFQIIFGTKSEILKEEIKVIMKNESTLTSPMNGDLLPISEVPDPTFSQKILGDGFAINPIDGMVHSPVDGKVVQLFHTNHAIGLQTANGAEVLIHIGIDTVKMKGEGFKSFVKVDDEIKRGDKLIEFDLKLVNEKAKSPITPIVITNMDKIQGIELLATGQVKNTQNVMNYTIH